jgi:CHASE2 domain-containing sensor protein
VGALLLIWITGAVGIIGSEDEPANLMYALVLAVGIVGAIIARFQPRGMAYALFATAVAQALAGIIALAAGWGSTSQNWPLDIVALTGFSVVLFGGAGLLFQKAARRQSAAGARSAG